MLSLQEGSSAAWEAVPPNLNTAYLSLHNVVTAEGSSAAGGAVLLGKQSLLTLTLPTLAYSML